MAWSDCARTGASSRASSTPTGGRKYQSRTDPTSLPKGDWVALALEVDLNRHELRISVNGTPVSSGTFDAAKDTLPHLVFGPAEPDTEPAQPWEILYDDIVVTAL